MIPPVLLPIDLGVDRSSGYTRLRRLIKEGEREREGWRGRGKEREGGKRREESEVSMYLSQQILERRR